MFFDVKAQIKGL